MIPGKSTARRNHTRVKKLIDAAVKRIDENAEAFVDALYQSVEEGHVQSARLLVDLATENTDVDEALQKKPLRSLALRLAAEPQLPRDSQGGPPATDDTVLVTTKA